MNRGTKSALGLGWDEQAAFHERLRYFDVHSARDVELTGMGTKPLHLWIAHPDDLLDGAAAEACAALLTDEERARWMRFRFEKHRREFLATRALVRNALSHYKRLPPAAWRFKANDHGKPATDPDCGLRFNLSNATGLVVCLVAEDGEVGVDVESPARADVMLRVAKEAFSAREREQLEMLADDEKLERALTLWTLKESYIKARGMGLKLPLEKFSFVFGGVEGVRLEVDASLENVAERWSFCMLDYAGHRIAAMVQRAKVGELEVLEVRPPLSNPMQVAAVSAEWFPR